MSDGEISGLDAAGELRRAFDESFSRARLETASEGTRTFLALRAGGAACAVRLAEVRGLESGRRIVPVPSSVPELAGLAGVRGKVVAVFNLARLLGNPGPAQACRWLMLCGESGELGLTFEELHGAFDAAARDLQSGAPGAAGEPVPNLVRHGAAVLPVIELASMAARLAGQLGPQTRTRGPELNDSGSRLGLAGAATETLRSRDGIERGADPPDAATRAKER